MSAGDVAARSYRAQHPVRFVTASSLFDGHDASINIMRRVLQAQGAEVIHLGHNRSVSEVVDAALEEDMQGVATGAAAPTTDVDRLLDEAQERLGEGARRALRQWPETVQAYGGDELVVTVGGRQLRTRPARASLSGSRIPRVTLPRYADHGELLRSPSAERSPSS
ncbi:hypothetical protein OOK36_45850 [Streptomyces sp. NBC_00365]|uniref:cobalamin B12-binding domain-containing protein n=1 Tax=Streptomyces sp. NBC_00365 TaxID=2975726 RepID=UPI0022505957|nr:hypothetical protein [Streptomyces sp. NBC_00365]MCX5095998.1 hypothetical protein [Streptomyces sp. NBC_00365]